MRVSDVMTRDVRLAGPDDTIGQAASIMAEIDAGAIPVGHNDRLVGMLTDRDIAVRAVAEGKGPDTRIGEIMSGEIKYCFEDQDTDEVCASLGDQKIRRIPVLNRDKRLVGILSLGDLAIRDGDGSTGEALSAISRPGGEHSQTGAMRH